MARERKSIEDRIQRQEEAVTGAKEHYDTEVAKLEKLMQKRDELQKKELMKAIEDSDKSFDDVMKFLQSDQPKNEDE